MAKRNQRRRRPEPPGPSGFVVVDKPPGMTSHDVVDRARRWFGTRRVGHLGTLDPQATGVLPLAIRAATKLIPFIEGGRKGYDGTVVLGSETDTLDCEGEVLRRFEGELPDQATVEAALKEFIGDIEQVPPMYSAVKKDGVPLHKLARQGKEVEREAKWITISSLEMTRFESPEFDLRVMASAGTYVRVLAADLGEDLGCGAHLGPLRRTQSGPFGIAQAHTSDALSEAAELGKLGEMLIAPEIALGFPVLSASREQAQHIRNGGDLPSGELHRGKPGTRISVLDEAGEFIAVAELRADRRIWPVRVLPQEPS
ncbi:MAG: tRNA pseudouridine(55) synthase TruB [Myxococcota bacterium]